MQKIESMRGKFESRLQQGTPIILDGGLATQLEAQGCDLDTPLWSASLLQSNPDAIVAAHSAYLEAGAECILTASYQASREGFANAGLRAEQADQLMLKSVDLARQATAKNRSDALVAASLGPYGAMLHDGSEYCGDYQVSKTTLRDFHEARLALFDSADVDVLALETVPSLVEAEVLASLLLDVTKPSWVSFSCKDGAHISDGTAIEKVAQLFADHPTVRAVGINCTPPQFAIALIEKLRQALPDKAIVVYPNSGESYSVTDSRWEGEATPVDMANAVQSWMKAGASIVGGCCRVSPKHIAAMAVATASCKRMRRRGPG